MATKLPGIYLIIDNTNGKIYIGQSVNILQRFKQYRWAAKSKCDYKDTSRDITKAIRKHGIENFEFIILLAGDEFKDAKLRCMIEREYINMYCADDPMYGYNESPGGEIGLQKPRKQSIKERNKRSKDVFLYDITNNSAILFFSGAKGVGKYLGYGKDVMSHTVKRGSLLENKFYIIPANYNERHQLLNKLEATKSKDNYSRQRSAKRASNTLSKYRNAVYDIDKIAVNIFGFTK